MKKSLYVSPVGAYGKKLLQRVIQRFGHGNFDFFIMVYDDTDLSDAIFSRCKIVHDKRSLFPQVKNFITPDIAQNYEYIFFWVDDIDILGFNPQHFLSIMRRYGLEVAQPALSPDSIISHPVTVHQSTKIGRYTDFVEQMVPVFTAEAWGKFWKLIEKDKYAWGWGYDMLAYGVCGFLKMAVIDAEIVKHLKKGNYVDQRLLSEQDELLRKHRLGHISLLKTIVNIPPPGFLARYAITPMLFGYKFYAMAISILKRIYRKCRRLLRPIMQLARHAGSLVYSVRISGYKAKKHITLAFLPRKEMTSEVQRTMQSYIARHQATDRGRFLVYSFDENQHWFGAAFDWLGAIFNAAVAENRILLMAQKDDWKLVPEKERACWDYYFESISPFNEEQALRRYKGEGVKVFRKAVRTSPLLYFKSSQGSWSGAREHYYPIEFKKYGYEAWSSEVMKYLYRPKPWVKSSVGTQCQRIGFDEDSIAFHVRRGDKISGPLKEGCFIPLQKYFSEAIKIRKKTGINKVFLVTDDEAVILEAENENMGFEIIHDVKEVRHAGFVAKYMISKEIGREQVQEETLTAFKNTHLLTKAKYLVGSRASFFFTLAEQLRLNGIGHSVSLGENERFFNFRQPL